MMSRSHRPQGFTLIELMVVVAIVGLLSSVALPMYRRATLRTRTAERSNLLQAMRMAIEDAYTRNNVPPPPGLVGPANPPGAPSVNKRSFQNGLGGWSKINMLVQGNCYYTYEFRASEVSPSTAATYWVSAIGDLDGDGVQSTKLFVSDRADGYWALTTEDPPSGQEDDASPSQSF